MRPSVLGVRLPECAACRGCPAGRVPGAKPQTCPPVIEGNQGPELTLTFEEVAGREASCRSSFLQQRERRTSSADEGLKRCSREKINYS